MKNQDKAGRRYRVVAFLNRGEMDFLDDLDKDIYFKYGVKISRSKLIEEIMEAFKEKDAQNREEIEQWICQKFMAEGLSSNKKDTEKA